MEKHISKKKAEGVDYGTICFVGDGSNDYCPAQRLHSKDYVFPRSDYALERMVFENGSKVKANVVPWDSATTILQTLLK